MNRSNHIIEKVVSITIALTAVCALGVASASGRSLEREMSTEDRAKLREMRLKFQGAYEGNKPTDLSKVPGGPEFADKCMAAWTYLGKDAIINRQGTLMLGEEFTEANAAWHWQHYLPGEISKYEPEKVKTFYASTFKAEQVIAEILQKPEGETEFFKILGECYRPPEKRSVKDASLILRNYLVGRKILPPQAALQPKQLDLFSETIATAGSTGLNPSVGLSACSDPLRQAKESAIRRCAQKGGYPLGNPEQTTSNAKTDLYGRETCVVTAKLQCAIY